MQTALQHKPLEAGEVRLLCRQRDTDTGRLRFILRHVRLVDNPKYTALSYRWGRQLYIWSIFINDINAQVTDNLYWCLHDLYYQDIGACLWVDAICIDQSNTEERNHQVTLMQDIYSIAENVLVWLGLEDIRTTRAFRIFQKVESAYFDDIVIQDIVHLLENRYWCRTWIVQEFLLAKEILLMCGKHVAPCTDLLSTLENVNSYKPTPEITQSSAYRLCVARSRLLSSGRWRPFDNLYDLLSTYGETQCSDVRDRIFGLLSLYDQSAVAAGARLKPDYSLSVEQLFFRTLASAQHSNHERRNTFFLLCGALQRSLRIQADREKVWSLIVEQEVASTQFSSRNLFPPIAYRHEQQPVVAVGRRVGTINELSSNAGKGVQSDEHFRRMCKDRPGEQCSQQLECLIDERWFDEVSMLAIDNPTDCGIKTCKDSTDLSDEDGAWLSFSESANIPALRPPHLDHSATSANIQSKRGTYAFIDSNGNIGLACPAACEGDVLCTMEQPSASLTLVLRHCRGDYVVIGRAILAANLVGGPMQSKHENEDSQDIQFTMELSAAIALSAYTEHRHSMFKTPERQPGLKSFLLPTLEASQGA